MSGVIIGISKLRFCVLPNVNSLPTCGAEYALTVMFDLKLRRIDRMRISVKLVE